MLQTAEACLGSRIPPWAAWRDPPSTPSYRGSCLIQLGVRNKQKDWQWDASEEEEMRGSRRSFVVGI